MRRFQSRVVDATNSLISAASVTVYKAGTSTLAALFSGEGLVALANPFKSDHQGVFEFYVEGGDYDLDARDPVTGFSRRFFDVSIFDVRNMAILKSGDSMQGQLLLASGSAASPGVGFVDSTGLGWFRQAANVLGGSIAGVEKMRFTGVGAVIGDIHISPVLAPLHVLRSGSAAYILSQAAGSDALTSRPVLFLRRSRGTLASNSTVLFNDILAEWLVQAHDGIGFGDALEMILSAGEDWNTAAHGTRTQFKRPRNGQTVRDVVIELSPTVADTETAILVQVNRAGVLTLDRVSFGAVDSAGAGFRSLRIPN